MKNLGMGEVSSQNAVGIYVENRKMRTGIKIEVYSSSVSMRIFLSDCAHAEKIDADY
jgi:hypothetical protein